MAASITPKSKAREITSISVGYGEVPVVEVNNRLGWGLPGRAVTFCREEALEWAAQLDRLIRSNMGSTQKLI